MEATTKIRGARARRRIPSDNPTHDQRHLAHFVSPQQPADVMNAPPCTAGRLTGGRGRDLRSRESYEKGAGAGAEGTEERGERSEECMGEGEGEGEERAKPTIFPKHSKK